MKRTYICERREKLGMNMGQLAKKLSIDGSMVGKVEAGLRNPSIPLAKKWAKCLGIPEEQIIKYFYA